MVLQVIGRLVQWRMVVLAISNPLHEGLPVVSPSATPFDPSTGLRTSCAQGELRTGSVESLSADSLARLWSGVSPVMTGGVLFDLAQGHYGPVAIVSRGFPNFRKVCVNYERVSYVSKRLSMLGEEGKN
jgi:hypothetical protein